MFVDCVRQVIVVHRWIMSRWIHENMHDKTASKNECVRRGIVIEDGLLRTGMPPGDARSKPWF